MPLSAPTAPRAHLHTRVIHCEGFQREDGLFDVEAHLTDVKTTPVSLSERGRLEVGDPVHDMWLRITVNTSMEILAAEAVIDKSPFQTCPGIAQAYQKLVGLTIGPGFHRKTRELFSKTNGCTHLLELITPLATTTFQLLYGGGPLSERARAAYSVDNPPPMLNSCWGYRADGPVTQRVAPMFYTGE